jgi:N-acyl-D-aspartate/D-glutamate deacylase
MSSFVLRGGLVVDGTGGPPVGADVAVDDDRIVAVGEVPATRSAEQIDVTGLVVAPGFIDVHTHFDAQVFWDPDLTPSTWHGVTTVVQGNCGFGIAPMRVADRNWMMETLAEVEGMSLETLRAGIPWSFESFPEYLDTLERLALGANVASYVGHTPLRMWVMGAEAASERAATDDEVTTMCGLLHAALDAGAVGLSTSFAPSHVGARGLPVASRLAGMHELHRLFQETAAAPDSVLGLTYGPPFEIEEIAELSSAMALRVTWGSLLTGLYGSEGAAVAMLERGSQPGADVWPQVSCKPLTTVIQFRETFHAPFVSVPAFREIITADPADRESIYRRPQWRAAAREDVRRSWPAGATVPHFTPDTFGKIWVDESRSRPELIGRRVTDLAAERRAEPFDVMLDLALDEHLDTRFRMARRNTYQDELAALLGDERTLLGVHDAGAHVDALCDANFPSYLLGHWVRERGILTLEQAIWRLSGQPASLFGLKDRGTIRPGAFADVVVFDAETIAPGPEERVWDFPASGDRLISESAGIEGVWINGRRTRHDGRPVAGQRPGRLLRRERAGSGRNYPRGR